MRAAWALSACFALRPATTVEAGIPWIISWAKLGPDRAHIPSRRPGARSSSITWLIRFPAGNSSPLEILRTVLPPAIAPATRRIFSRNRWEGTAMITRPAPGTSCSTSLATVNEGGRATPGRNRRCSRWAFNSAASDSSRTKILTGPTVSPEWCPKWWRRPRRWSRCRTSGRWNGIQSTEDSISGGWSQDKLRDFPYFRGRPELCAGVLYSRGPASRKMQRRPKAPARWSCPGAARSLPEFSGCCPGAAR